MPGFNKIALAASGSAAVVSGLFLKKNSRKDDPIGAPLWDVMKVGNDLEKVKAEYAATLTSGELKADGYNPTGCFPDLNLKTRDVHDEEMSYEGPISVIKYENVVPKTEQEPMTHSVCYEFCRRFDGIKFFAITNGEKCYCEPMFNVATAGNSGGCKTPCMGNSGQMCGGPDMSSVFALHNCPPKERFSSDKMTEFTTLKTEVATVGDATKACVDNLVKAGSKLVETQKQKGNTVSMPHQKSMTMGYQTIVGDLNALPFEAAKVSAELESAIGAYSGLGPGAKESDVEAAMKAIELAADAAAAAKPKLEKVYEQCHPNVTTTGEAVTFYTPINNSTSAQSCGGKVIGTPSIVSGDNPVDSCAQMCQNTLAPEQCVGFQVYKGLLTETYQAPTWTKFADEWGFGYCFGRVRFGKGDRWAEADDMGWYPFCDRYRVGGVDPWYGQVKECQCSTMETQVRSAGEVCMLFSEISGVTQYNKPDCPTTAPLEGRCYVPQTELSGHLLHTKTDTVSLPYCFEDA